MRKSSIGTLVAALSTLVLVACGLQPLEPRPPSEGAVHVTVATFNVHYPTGGDRATLRAVSRTGADVVFLQEVDARWEQALRREAPREYPHMILHPDEGPRGLGVLSRYPIEDGGVLRAPHDWHPGWRVFVQTPGGRVQVLVVHLRALFDGKGNPASSYFNTEKDHVRELEHFFQGHQDLPTIVLGDFNEGTGGQAVRWLEARGYRNALPLFRPGQPTWRGRSLAGQFELIIDHVLFDASFEPLNAWVSDRGSSDHFPVVAHLELVGSTRTAASGAEEVPPTDDVPAPKRAGKPSEHVADDG